MKKAKAFTIVELLTVIAIISILVGLTVPALNEAKWYVKAMTVRNDFRSYELGLETFYQDMGFYPSSKPRNMLIKNNPVPHATLFDQGAHVLFESLVGLDQLGYQKDHQYEFDPATGKPIIRKPPMMMPTFTTRSNPYIELIPDRFDSLVNCYPDSAFLNANPVFVDGLDYERPRPILYFRANTQRKVLFDTTPYLTLPEPIYEYYDNDLITRLSPAFGTPPDCGMAVASGREYFFHYIFNPKTGGGNIMDITARPYETDKFMLISAGRDGIFGPNPENNFKNDDITNFDKY